MKNKPNFRKRILWIWVTIGLVLGAIIIFVVHNQNKDADYLPRVCGGDRCFMVELARTSVEQQKGLMFRESIEEGNGMLFIFNQPGIHNFWMKNTLIPLDMLRIDDQFTVVKVLTAEPCTADHCPTYNPGVPAKYVLEINAGMAQKHGIAEGTKMRFVNIQ